MNFKVFLLIFALPIFLSKYPPIFSDISDISVKSKYRYIRKYRYFVPCSHPLHVPGQKMEKKMSFSFHLISFLSSHLPLVNLPLVDLDFLSYYPPTLDFHPIRRCHMSTWAPLGSPCLINSAPDTWHLLSHSKCVKCPALPPLPRKM